MLQHTSRFLSKEQCDNTGATLHSALSWPGSSWFLPVPLTEISTLGKAFLCATENIKNVMEELKRLSKMAYGNVSNALQSPAKMPNYTRLLFWTKSSLKCNVLYFSEIKWFLEHLKPQSTIFPTVIYGCKIWYVILKDEDRKRYSRTSCSRRRLDIIGTRERETRRDSNIYLPISR